MAQSHADCQHPSTRAARAKCRKARGQGKSTKVRRPDMESNYAKQTGARVYEVVDLPENKGHRLIPVPQDVVAKVGQESISVAGAKHIVDHPADYSDDQVGTARRYLFGS